jgi:hypothetical protein
LFLITLGGFSGRVNFSKWRRAVSVGMAGKKVTFEVTDPSPTSVIENGGSGTEDSLFFDTSKEACTPLITRVQYRAPEERAAATAVVAPASSITRPNYEDILRRVSVVVHQHINKCESKLSQIDGELESPEAITFRASMIEMFNEKNYVSPQYMYHFVRAPISRLGFLYGIQKLDKPPQAPELAEVHTFLRDLFVKAQLSPECSIGEPFYLICVPITTI